jgi:hypothetical protein
MRRDLGPCARIIRILKVGGHAPDEPASRGYDRGRRVMCIMKRGETALSEKPHYRVLAGHLQFL